MIPGVHAQLIGLAGREAVHGLVDAGHVRDSPLEVDLGVGAIHVILAAGAKRFVNVVVFRYDDAAGGIIN
jgi:hypothetical protein